MSTAGFTASIVLYHNNRVDVKTAIESTLRTPGLQKLYLFDNSRDRSLETVVTDERICYAKSATNVGFGAGHNWALSESSSAYHAIINPDVEFAPTVIPELLKHVESNRAVAMSGPRLSKDGIRSEHCCRAVPTPFDIVARRFFSRSLSRELTSRLARFEMHDLPQDRPSDVPILSGAFLVASMDALRAVGGFDSRFFLYFEDYDLCMALGKLGYRCVHDPRVLVKHHYGAHSYRSIKPFIWHLRSATKYFNKWGWWPLS